MNIKIIIGLVISLVFVLIFVKAFSEMPNDPYFLNGNQWSLYPDDSIAHINAAKAWEIEKGSSEIIIAIIDSGIKYDHEDLANKMWVNEDEIPNNSVDDDNNGYIDDVIGWDFVNTTNASCSDSEDCFDEDNDPMDGNGHGTSTAGLAGAETDNGIGIASLCQECKIMNLRVGYTPQSGAGVSFYPSGVKDAIYYATDNGADIISMSVRVGSLGEICYSYPDIDAAMDYAYDNGVVLVGAAGNNNEDLYFYPACYEKVIAVANHQSDGDRYYSSNYGDWVEVAAPGASVVSTKITGGYGLGSGTSMATPIVSGLSGLLISSYPDLTPAMIKEIIMGSSEQLNWTEPINGSGGRINAYEAISVCVVGDGIYYNNECILGDKPNKCFEQELVSSCRKCGCPRKSSICMPNGECVKSNLLRATAISLPGEIL